MKKKFFAFIFYLITSTNASDHVEIKYPITIAQILATPNRNIFIGNNLQVAIWKELIKDIMSIIEHSSTTQNENTMNLLKQIIVDGFQPSKFNINEQSLVAIMFFMSSINTDLKTVRLQISKKTYSSGNFECFKAIKDHIFFAKLVGKNKISCKKINERPVYHPLNFDYENVPPIISKIARCYGPFFQDISLQNKLNPPHNSLIYYAQFTRDPRTQKNNGEFYLTFPNPLLNSNFK